MDDPIPNPQEGAQSSPGSPSAETSSIQTSSDSDATEVLSEAGLDKTQEANHNAHDKTQAVAPPIGQEEADRRLALELSRRGVPPDEVQRLVRLGRAETAPVSGKGKAVAAVASPPVIPPSEAFIPTPTISLPEYRESSQQERTEADRMLTSANIERRRGRLADAEKQCRAAIDLIPSDGAALEMYGDILQALGRVDDAVYSYGRAKEADPKRRSAEKKFAELTLMQNREIQLLRVEFIPRNPTVAVVFSALFPGAGQVYNGDVLKGLLVVVIFILSVFVLGWTNLGFSASKSQITAPLVFFMLLAGGVYIYGVVDANLSARRGKRPRSGWEV